MVSSSDPPLDFGELCNYEAEQALLGAILYRNDLYDEVADILDAEAFADPTLALIYHVAGQMIGRDQQANAVTLKAYFERDENLQAVGGASFLAELQGSYVGLMNLPDYAAVINDYALRRRAAEAAMDLLDAVKDAEPDRSPRAILEQHAAAIDGITGTGGKLGLRAAAEEIPEITEQLIDAAQRYRGGGVAGLSTGFGRVDRALCGGFRKRKLYVLGGGTSMGKTALATAMIERVAAQGVPVAVFSMEMGHDELLLRMACARARVELSRAQMGSFSDAEYQAIKRELAALGAMPIHIDESMSNTTEAIRAETRRLQRRCPLGLVVVDYLQLCEAPHARKTGGNRTAEITEISRRLKMAAAQLNVPFLVLSQLSREHQNRDDRRPILKDLRESGSLEQDADVVIFVYRDAYYLERDGRKPKQSEDEWRADLEAVRNKAEFIVRKQRSGPLGTVVLHFDAPYTYFAENPDRQEEIAL